MATYGPIRYGGFIDSGAISGTVTYTNPTDLPTSNVSTGARAYVSDTNKLYMWNGTAWFNIAIVNQAPTAITGNQATYVLAKDGTPTVVTLVSTDPEGLPLTFSSSTSGDTQVGTVTNTDNVFTITPSTNEADIGTLSVTFSVTDGNNTETSVSSFILIFVIAAGGTESVIDVAGVNYVLHEFTSNGTFDLYADIEVEYVLVGGGGAGGSGEAATAGDGGGGGGAGGVLQATQTLPAGLYSVNIGQGGQGSSYHSHPAGDGGDTSLVGPITLTAFGGGSGGHDNQFGQDGGSSGGAGGICTNATGAGNLEGINQGYRGGEVPGNTSCRYLRGGAGGGGAGSAGGINRNGGGSAGNGIDVTITGSTVGIAGGGGGGRGSSSAQLINGSSIGGGGAGGGGDRNGSAPGAAGGGGASGGFSGGNGYQGVVWIRYIQGYSL